MVSFYVRSIHEGPHFQCSVSLPSGDLEGFGVRFSGSVVVRFLKPHGSSVAGQKTPRLVRIRRDQR